MTNRQSLMGYPINTFPLSQVVDHCSQHIDMFHDRNMVFSCANPHALATAEQQQEFRQSLINSDILVTDGVGVSIVGKLLRKNVGPRITGSDFFAALLHQQNQLSVQGHRRYRVFFFGSSERVLDLMKKTLSERYSHLDLCGFISPPFGNWSDEINQQYIQSINDAKPDILWVGMTAPKQELWTQRNRHLLRVPIIGNVGAVFDFTAGTYQRAPVWARKLGLEWLVRLLKEPKRMWRRNVISPIQFVIAALKVDVFKWTTHNPI